jgi:hypothetical protein
MIMKVKKRMRVSKGRLTRSARVMFEVASKNSLMIEVIG